MTSGCIFCRIIAGAVEASFVHRDELVSAFLDIRPVTPGHLLVVPNDDVVAMHELPDVVRAEGTNLFVADGEAAGQDVFHAHLHVIPRFTGDGFTIDAAAWRDPPPTRDELNRRAVAIRSAMRSGS